MTTKTETVSVVLHTEVDIELAHRLAQAKRAETVLTKKADAAKSGTKKALNLLWAVAPEFAQASGKEAILVETDDGEAILQLTKARAAVNLDVMEFIRQVLWDAGLSKDIVEDHILAPLEAAGLLDMLKVSVKEAKASYGDIYEASSTTEHTGTRTIKPLG